MRNFVDILNEIFPNTDDERMSRVFDEVGGLGWKPASVVTTRENRVRTVAAAANRRIAMSAWLDSHAGRRFRGIKHQFWLFESHSDAVHFLLRCSNGFEEDIT